MTYNTYFIRFRNNISSLNEYQSMKNRSHNELMIIKITIIVK